MPLARAIRHRPSGDPGQATDSARDAVEWSERISGREYRRSSASEGDGTGRQESERFSSTEEGGEPKP